MFYRVTPFLQSGSISYPVFQAIPGELRVGNVATDLLTNGPPCCATLQHRRGPKLFHPLAAAVLRFRCSSRRLR